jgi:hypothetical protein
MRLFQTGHNFVFIHVYLSTFNMFKIIKENEILIVPINQSLTQKVLLKKSSGGENCFKNINYYLS